MAAHDYLEDLSSLLPAVALLNKLGFTYLTPSEQIVLRGGRTSKCVLESVLADQLQKFNRISFNLKTAVEHIPTNKNQHKVDKENLSCVERLAHVTYQIWRF
jgi:hypothetical protein